MYVKVLYDNRAKRGFVPGHGFACLLDGAVLFDTGEASQSLLDNMKKMMVSPGEIKAVVLSHEHWDHTGGLWEVIKRCPGIKVYACPSFSETFKKCVVESGGELVLAGGPMDIAPGIMTTGEIGAVYKDQYIAEQALIVKGDKGFSVITGCAHPGLLPMLKRIKETLGVPEFYMVFGGFHLTGMGMEEITGVISDMKSIGVYKVGPMHCTGDKAIRMFGGQYHGNFVPVKAGHIIHL
ncbi:MAG: MBL fold metallo-hydrolase [Candidatus Omnitrophica bacterium]|nr:MBL fold metallo-hydrolase [Candidatus Omnitrophota bacterium]MDD4013832.1 MBL fold metallo-hydrolase [Candidatus Omnitrophota bacterium]